MMLILILARSKTNLSSAVLVESSVVSHVVNPSLFYFQRSGDARKIQTLSASVEGAAKKLDFGTITSVENGEVPC